MPIEGVAQPDNIQVDGTLRLRKFDGVYGFALDWYRDVETVRLVDGKDELYTPERLKRMYDYLSAHGELYFIEVCDEEGYRPIGDVTFGRDDMPIVIGDRTYRGQGIGRRVVAALIRRGRELGYSALRVDEIYDFNTASRRCFESVGFQAYERTEKGWRYQLKL